MNVESNVLQVEHLSQVPFNDLLSLYRQGYRLGQNSDIGIELGLSVYNKRGDNINNINNVNNVRSLASCPSTVTTGATLTLSATASSGTAPYTYHWSVKKPDSSTDTSLTGSSNSYAFAQDGSYIVSVYVTDSCAAGAKTSPTDSCTIVASAGDGGCINPKYKCSDQQCVSDNCDGTGTFPNSSCGTGCGGVVNNYGCLGDQCLQGYGNLPPGCNNTCVGGGGGITCNADQYPVLGKCYSKNTVYIAGGIGLVVLLVLMK